MQGKKYHPVCRQGTNPSLTLALPHDTRIHSFWLGLIANVKKTNACSSEKHTKWVNYAWRLYYCEIFIPIFPEHRRFKSTLLGHLLAGPLTVSVE